MSHNKRALLLILLGSVLFSLSSLLPTLGFIWKDLNLITFSYMLAIVTLFYVLAVDNSVFKLKIIGKSWLKFFFLFKILQVVLSLGIMFIIILSITYYGVDIALRLYYLIWCLLIMVLVFRSATS